MLHWLSLICAYYQWAHFPHIHFGLMPDQGLKKTFKTQVSNKADIETLITRCIYLYASKSSLDTLTENLPSATLDYHIYASLEFNFVIQSFVLCQHACTHLNFSCFLGCDIQDGAEDILLKDGLYAAAGAAAANMGITPF